MGNDVYPTEIDRNYVYSSSNTSSSSSLGGGGGDTTMSKNRMIRTLFKFLTRQTDRSTIRLSEKIEGNDVYETQIDSDYSLSSSDVSSSSSSSVGVVGPVDDDLPAANEQDETPLEVSDVSLLLGRAWTVGLGIAVEVLDTLGSSMKDLNPTGFSMGATMKGTKISILAFEVANTIVKGANLMRSLSNENIEYLKGVVLPSEGVQLLVSEDMEELLQIAASDKRQELEVFSRVVVRFGNRCKGPLWHNLNSIFERMDSEIGMQKQLKEVERVMQHLMTMVQYTPDLYHELHALDRYEQDYRRKLQEEDSSTAAQRGDDLAIVRAELRSQEKRVRILKKKSLWSKDFEEVMEKLVDIVRFLHQRINDAFGRADIEKQVKGSQNNHLRLGPAGLALQYANIITRIDTLVSQSSFMNPNTRDNLYQSLPLSLKSGLLYKLQAFHLKEELTVPQIKAEMEKTLQWLVPIATNTTKAHHGFGWVGEWTNTESTINRKPAGSTEFTMIETLHHADKGKTEACITELIMWLHLLISRSRLGINGGISPIISPIFAPPLEASSVPNDNSNSSMRTLTYEDEEMLRDVNKRKLTPGISKSQKINSGRKWLGTHTRLSKSNSNPTTTSREIFSIRRFPSLPIFDSDIDKMKALDVIDRIDGL